MYNEQSEINRDTLLKDEQFLDDATAFLIDRGGYDPEDLMSAEDVYENYMEHFRYQNVNEVTAVNDLLYAQNADDNAKARFARLMDTYDNMDSDLGWAAAGDYVAGVLTAPSTYAGIFTGGGAKVGALAAQQGVKLGIRQLLKSGVAGQALRQAATKGAVRAGAVEGTIGAGHALAQEKTRVETGLQEEVSGAQVAVGALASAVPGAAFGAASQVKRAIDENVATRVMNITQKTVERQTRLANRGVTKDVFENEETSELANNIYSALKEKKLSLEETIPEELARGRELKQELAPEPADVVDVPGRKMPLEASVSNMHLQNIAAVAAKITKEIGQLPPLKNLPEGETGVERFTSKIIRGFNANLIDNDKIVAIAREHGVQYSDIASLFGAEISNGGSILGKLSGLARASRESILKELDEIDKIMLEAGDLTTPARAELEKIEQQIGKDPLTKINDVMRNINKARIGFMTVQLATTSRNMTNGYMRNLVYGFDNLGASLYNVAFSNKQARKALIKQGVIDPTDEQLKVEAERAVRLGMAQLRTAVDSFMFKDLMLGLNSTQAVTLAKLMRNPEFGQSDLARQLFMEMGDVADHTGQKSLLLNTARFLNKLNTKSDNMFKRAILGRELNKAIIAAGYDGGLNGILKQGRFTSIDQRVIAKGMEEALDFTYQTGRFKGKEGVFNSAAQTFIDASQTQLGSVFVPFPRYMVNQFRFFYEHAPILGLIDAFGILNKSDAADRFGKQIGGFTALTALYALRANHGDETTGPFEYKNPFGSGLVDAQAMLGPFSAHAVVADAIYRWTNPEVSQEAPVNYRDIVKALGGGQFRGTGLGLVDGLFDAWQKGIDDGETDLALKEMSAKFLGNYFSTYTVGAGVLKDVVATLDPEMRIVADNKDIEFWPYVFKQATRSFPRAVDGTEGFFLGRKPLASPTKADGIRIMNPFMRQLTGLTQQEQRNLAETEFDRLGLEWTEIAPRKIKFDPELSGEQNAMMGKWVETGLSEYIARDPIYNQLETDIEKKAILKAKINELRSEARSRVLNVDKYQDIESQRQVARAIFYNQISSAKRDLITLYYKRVTGKDLDDTKDYITALAVAEQYNMYKVKR